MKKSKLPAMILFLLIAAITGKLRAQNDHYPQFIEMGNKALANKSYDLALDYYNSAIDDKSDCWQAYVGLGNCFYFQRKFKDSLKNYEKALKINPENGELVKFIQFLKTKMGIAPIPTPVPTWTPIPIPTLVPLPPLGSAPPMVPR